MLSAAEQPATVSVVQSNPIQSVRFAVAPTVVETPVQQQVQVLERFVLPQQQQRQAIYQDGQSVFRSPTVTGSYGGEQNFVVSRTQPTSSISYGSTSHLDSFLRNLVVGRSSNGYGQQFQVVGNGLTNFGTTAAVQDDVINIDSFGRII
jgi:hypothetical protein